MIADPRASKSDKTLAKQEVIEKSIDKLFKCYFLRLIVISDIINRYVATNFKDEVNWLKIRALVSLITRGNKGAITPTELAHILMRPLPNITELIKDLEKDGLVVKRSQKKDKRVVIVKITNAGLSYLENSLDMLVSSEKELCYCLDKSELEIIPNMTRKILRHFEKLSIDKFKV